MNGKNEIIYSPNSAIDYAIKKMLPNFPLQSQNRMVKAILSAKRAALKHNDENTDAAARHIFREFVAANHLNQIGFAFEYEIDIDGKRPDWFDKEKSLILESYTFERGGRSEFTQRINDTISAKCNNYKEIVTRNNLRFSIAVYLDFLSTVSINECKEGYYDFSPIFCTNEILDAKVIQK